MVLSKNRPRFTGFAPRPFGKLFNNSAEMPSNDFMNKIGATLPEKMAFKTPLDSALNTNGATVSQGGKLAEGLGKAGSVAGGVMSGLGAVNDFANGDYVNGGLNATKTAATFIPGAQPVAATIQGAQIAKDLFGGLFGGGDDGSESLNETMNIRKNALNQTRQFAQNMQNQTQDYSQPVITGGAAPAEPQLTPIQEYQNALREQGYSDDVINGIPQGLNSGDKNIAQWIEQYNNGSGRDNPIRIPQTAEEIAAAKAGSFNAPTQTAGASENIKKGLLDKFINGVSDFSRGYQENRNNGFNPNNLAADKFTETVVNPADTQKITDYQNQLENDENYNNWVNRAGVDKAAAIKAIKEGKNSGNADVDNWIKNNQDAYNETTTEKTYDKGKMARVGEAIGSIARIAQNPTVQGLIAGGLSTALTGNPLYGLGQGYKFANNRAMSNVRREALKEFGIDVPEVGTFGNLTDADMKSLMLPKIEDMKNERAWAQLKALTDYRNGSLENQQERNKIAQQNADLRKSQQENKYNQPPKGRNIPGYYKEFVNYKNLVESGKDIEKIKNEYSRLLQKYGNDFMKDAKGIKRQKYDPTIISDNSVSDDIPTLGGQNNVQMVSLQAPDGQVRKVPAAQADYYIKKGAKLING